MPLVWNTAVRHLEASVDLRESETSVSVANVDSVKQRDWDMLGGWNALWRED